MGLSLNRSYAISYFCTKPTLLRLSDSELSFISYFELCPTFVSLFRILAITMVLSCALCPKSEPSLARSKPNRGGSATSARRRWLSCLNCLLKTMCRHERCSSLKIFLSQRSLTDERYVGLYGQAKPVAPASHKHLKQS